MPEALKSSPLRTSKSRDLGIWCGLCALLVLAGLAQLGLGSASLSDPSTGTAVLELRLLRLCIAGLAGAGLAVAGVLAQGLLRNPLASPDVIGATAGATLGAQLVLAGCAASGLLFAMPGFVPPAAVLPLGALGGAGLTLSALLALSRAAERSSPAGQGTIIVLLAGFVVNALLQGVSALLLALYRGDWQVQRAMLDLAQGRLSGSGPEQLGLGLPLIGLGLVAAFLWARPLDLLLTGEAEAQSLGLRVRRARGWILVWTAVLAGAATAIGGAAPFVGLVVPHALRLLFGDGHRRLVIAAALGGAAFLIACDALARGLPAWLGTTGGELPLAVVTGLIGAPVFLGLLLRRSPS